MLHYKKEYFRKDDTLQKEYALSCNWIFGWNSFLEGEPFRKSTEILIAQVRGGLSTAQHYSRVHYPMQLSFCLEFLLESWAISKIS